MDSDFNILFSNYFERQWISYDWNTQRRIEKKIELIEKHPFRFKKHQGYKHIFKVKLNIENEYSRLMYAVFTPDSKSVSILGVFPRRLNYKDFERIFGYMKK